MAVQHFDRNDISLLGNTVFQTSNNTAFGKVRSAPVRFKGTPNPRDMCTMAIIIYVFITLTEGNTPTGTTLESFLTEWLVSSENIDGIEPTWVVRMPVS